MRLFLDAHASGHRVARALRTEGHDVRAADEDEATSGDRKGSTARLAKR
jgi:hypothetical protein